jgi:AcrR family transcriptional regulator
MTLGDIKASTAMSLGVINLTRLVAMARWQPDACGRLQEAALTLYGEQGYENTTVTQIAESAGLTKRTFFRHFADKREVLFHGSGQLQELFETEVANAPESAAPLDAVATALDAVAVEFEKRREGAAARQQIIAANPELQERELIKLAALAEAVAEALRRRGVGDPAAILTAEAGMTVFRVAFGHWVDPANRKAFQQLIRESLEELRAVTRR